MTGDTVQFILGRLYCKLVLDSWEIVQGAHLLNKRYVVLEFSDLAKFHFTIPRFVFTLYRNWIQCLKFWNAIPLNRKTLWASIEGQITKKKDKAPVILLYLDQAFSRDLLNNMYHAIEANTA